MRGRFGPWLVLLSPLVALSLVFIGYLAYSFADPNEPPHLTPSDIASAPGGTPEDRPHATQDKLRAEVTSATPFDQPVPVSTDAPSEVSCPSDWLYFDNPLLDYSLCYPNTWSFSDGSSPTPLKSLKFSALSGLAILSEEWFPYPVGSSRQEFSPSDAARTDGGSWANVTLVRSGIAIKSGCDLTNERLVGEVSFKWCVETFNLEGGEGVPDPSGKYKQLVASLQLKSTRLTLEPGDAVPSLLVTVGTSAASFNDKEKTLWLLIESIRPY